LIPIHTYFPSLGSNLELEARAQSNPALKRNDRVVPSAPWARGLRSAETAWVGRWYLDPSNLDRGVDSV
jgi:hypothetical protein